MTRTGESVKLGQLHVGPVIPVSDLNRSRHFYEVQLGMRGTPAPGGYALECSDGSSVYLLESTDYPGHAEWPLASFATDDLEAATDGLRSSGVELVTFADGPNKTDDRGIATLPGMHIAWVRDPDNQVLSIFQLTGD